VWLAIIAVAVITAFQNGVSSPFLLDDEISIQQNESLRKLTPLSSVLWPRAEVYTAGRPLLNLSFALNYAVGGTSVRGYHFVNILIHVVAAGVLFGVVRRTLLLPALRPKFGHHAPLAAVATALLWGLHPLQTESVTYLSQRAESLMGLLYVSTLYGFIRSAANPRSGWSVFAVGCCAAGVLVKEVIVTAPVMLLLYDRTFLAGTFKEAWRIRRWLYVGLASTWVLLLALMIASRVGARGIGYGFDYSWHQYLRIECAAVLHYLRLALLPFGLVFDYGKEVTVPSTASLAACILGLAALLAVTMIAFRRRSPVGFLGCWFFLILAPTSSVLPVAGQPIAENRVYLPLAAVSVALAGASFHVLRRRAVLALAAAAVALGWLTVIRNRDYRSNLAIWTDTLAKRPESARAWCYYGNALLQDGKIDPAMTSFESAIKIRPTYSQAHINLACALLSKQRPDDAIRHFETALRLSPNEPLAHNNLGTALFQVGRRAEAVEHYQEALRVRPGFVDAQLNLGIVLAHLGRTSEALAIFEQLVRENPQNQPARDNLLQLRAALQQKSPSTPGR
jgi:tetratricopeptide (TPR) repeat protein